MAALVAWTGVVSPAAAQERGITLLRDAETEAYLRQVTTPIFNAAGIEPGAVTIYLVNDEEMNAFVSGGQNLFLNTGLIAAAELPNELNGVIAHETGHMAGGHLTRGPGGGGSVPTIVGMVLGIGAMIAGAPDAGQAIIAGSTTIAQRNILAYSRVQEASADQAAARFLEKAGQSGKGLVTFFDRLRDLEVMSSRNIDPFIQSHPVSAERMRSLQAKVEASPYYNKEDPPGEVAQLDLIRAKIHGFLDPVDVGLRRFPVSDKSAPARYARSVLYFRQGSLGAAQAEVNSLIAEQPKNPYFLELKGQELYESGSIEAAVAPYAAAVAAAPDQPLIRTGYGQALVAAAEAKNDAAMTEKAAAELRRAVDAEPGLPMAWQALGQAYSAQGKLGLAELATAEMYFNVGAVGPAMEFALRARNKLDKGTVPYNRATDILQVARASGLKGQRGRN